MNPPLVIIPQFFGCLLFDRRTSRYMPFDRECTELLLRLRSEPIETMVSRSGTDRRRLLMGFYEYFYDLGFFHWNGLLPADLIEASPPPDHLLGPLAVHLEVVAACNLGCTHCFAGELPRSGTPLGLDELDGLFATLARMGSFRLGLTGGEPLLRRELFEIIDLATSHGLHPCLTTNGLLITEEIAREFGKRDLVWLNVSLDGAGSRTNDGVRGEGTYRRVLEKLAILRRHARFTLAFTILSTNAHEVEDCARLARDVGAQTAVFRPLYPVGIAKRHPELMPGFRQYTEALEKLSGAAIPSGEIVALDPFSPQSRRRIQSRVTLNDGCGAANLVCSVSVKGDVNPCSFLGEEHIAGNIRETPFEEIWHSSRGFRLLRDRAGDEDCASCHGGPGFRGGCRARALALHGSIHASDPWHDEFLENDRARHPLSNVEVESSLEEA
jgi:radical SAM protein with 4Fe4S-binding SPASM domain